MAAYIQHVASRGLDHQLDRLKQLTTEFRDRAMREEVHGHARTPGILADLAAGYRLFLEWAGTVVSQIWTQWQRARNTGSGSARSPRTRPRSRRRRTTLYGGETWYTVH